MHPGDIQIAHNVLPPPTHPLRRLRNSIVFSQKGERDLPSQLSGGDLDGDIFSVIWDQEAFPAGEEGKRGFRAADYPRVAPVDIGRRVVKQDMAEFFVCFFFLFLFFFFS